MKKIFIKSAIISFAAWYAVFSVSMPTLVLAEETETTQTETTNSTEPTPTPTPEPTNIETGNADSSATAQSEANSAETEVPGSLEGQNCEGPETTCPQDTQVETTQDAQTDTGSSATSETGENEATTSGDLTLETGDATSEATTTSQDNTNVVELSESTEGESLPRSDGTATLDVTTEQNAEATASAEATSETGENLATSESILELLTGDALSIATLINMANINLVGSDLIWLIKTILGIEEEDINLYELFAQLPEVQIGNIPQDTTITTDQTSNLESQTSATSDTGNNTASGSDVTLETGDAAAIANTVNLTNFNLVGTRALFAIVNILGSLNGDIVLPNGMHLSYSSFPWGNTQLITNQTALIESGASAQSNSGGNLLEGGGSQTTGEATAISNVQSFANLIRIGDAWGFLIINYFGNWQGQLRNWDEPGSIQSLDYGTNALEQDWDTPLPDASAENDNGGSLTVVTNQDTTVSSLTSANSNTGANSIFGRGRLITGSAFSLANDFTLANLVGIGGSFLFGIFNILGNWVGNLVVAYPDLEVSVSDGLSEITPGSQSQYTVVVTNLGAAWAREVYANLSFQGEYLPGDGFSGGWDVGNLGPGENRSYQVTGTVSPTALSGTEILASAQVENHETEESNTNNTASDSTIIVLPPSEPESGTGTGTKDTRLPTLAVSVWHNVNEFVYPGDTVLASITVANQSSFTAHDVRVFGQLSNDHPMPPIPMSWNLGNLRAGERVKIEFAIGLINNVPEGAYHLSAEAKGRSEASDESSSGVVTSDFFVRLKQIVAALAPTVLASGEAVSSAQTLGESSENSPFDIKRYLPYILATSILTFGVISALRRKMDGKAILPAFLRRKRNEKDNS